MNTGVVSTGYKCVFYSTLGSKGWFAVPTAHECPFCVCVICVYVFLLLAEEIRPSSPRGSCFIQLTRVQGVRLSSRPQGVFAELRSSHASQEPTTSILFAATSRGPVGSRDKHLVRASWVLWPASNYCLKTVPWFDMCRLNPSYPAWVSLSFCFPRLWIQKQEGGKRF